MITTLAAQSASLNHSSTTPPAHPVELSLFSFNCEAQFVSQWISYPTTPRPDSSTAQSKAGRLEKLTGMSSLLSFVQNLICQLALLPFSHIRNFRPLGSPLNHILLALFPEQRSS